MLKVALQIGYLSKWACFVELNVHLLLTANGEVKKEVYNFSYHEVNLNCHSLLQCLELVFWWVNNDTVPNVVFLFIKAVIYLFWRPGEEQMISVKP